MRRPPRATRTDPLIPPRRSSDLPWPRHPAAGAELGQDAERVADPHVPGPAARHLPRPRHHGDGARPEPAGRRPARFAGPAPQAPRLGRATMRSEEHTSELQSLMRISYAVFCLKKKLANML